MAFVHLNHDERGFSTLTITSPDNRNAFTTEAEVYEFVAALDEVGVRHATSALIVTGEGVNQVETDPVEVLLGDIQGPQPFACRMSTAEESEGVVVEALQAEADAVQPGNERCPHRDAPGITGPASRARCGPLRRARVR